jgi:PmbA protein
MQARGAIEGPQELPVLRDVVLRVLEEARRQGASGADVAVATGVGLSVRVRLGQAERVEHHRSQGLGVSVYFGFRKGSASTASLSPEALRETVEAACRIARHTAEDPCHGLADARLMPHEVPDLDLYHPWELPAEQAMELAGACEAAARGLDRRISNSEGAGVSWHLGTRVYGNSHGFIGGWSSSRHTLSCTVIADDGSGMQRDHWYTTARDPAALESAEAVGTRAAERALRRLGARKIATCRVPVLFAAPQATGLLGSFVGAVRGGNLYRRASFLVDHLGRQVFPTGFGLREEPHLPGALGSAPFDGDGVATRPRELVRDGVLEGYVLDSYSGCRLGLPSTGNAGGIHNLLVTHGADDQAGLLARMGRGLLVSELMGMGINLVTGDYSRGAAGFWVEGGEIRHPVHEVTVAGNLRDMFLGIQAVGRDVDLRGNIRTGSILVDEMTVAGS